MARIRDLMQSHIVSATKDTRLGSAAKLMKAAHVSVLPVLDGERLFGVIDSAQAERELGRWGEEKRLGELRLKMFFAEAEDKPESVAKVMVANKISRLPVVDSASSMRCIGTISATEIARKHKKKLF
ncbi:MAG: CBS domain-containing protein [Candidatus Micrarchaeota archaeon]|nr:CBS domain-containing protein [Candidatus Micrarchaeota archaeon]